jgi:hypothetical protein
MKPKRISMMVTVIAGLLFGGGLSYMFAPAKAAAKCGQDGISCIESETCYTDYAGNNNTVCTGYTWDANCGCYVGHCDNGNKGCIPI